MKKIKLIIAAAALLGLASSSAVFADGFAPGEGMYVGAFAGQGFGIAAPKVTTLGNLESTTNRGESDHPGGTWQSDDGGLGLEGFEGGGWIGYGYKMGGLYAGLEGEVAASDVKFKVSGTAVELTDGDLITSVEAEKKWTSGMFGRLGYYVNPDTLLSLKGGVLVSKFEVTTAGTNQNFTEDYYGGGPAFGASLTSRLTDVDPNLSVRIGAVYTDFLTASVFGIGTNKGSMGRSAGTVAGDPQGHDSEISGSALSARIGLQYSFFDVNSLF